MAIEITPKAEVKKVLWPAVFLIATIIISLILLTTYFYFDYASKRMTEEIGEKTNAIKRTSAEKLLEDKVLNWESKINLFASLLAKHKEPLNIFEFLEDFCHPDVWFAEFNLTSDNNLVVVSGNAKSFIALGQQILIFKESESFKKVNLSEISIGKEGGVDFALQLTFEPRIFK